jgi:hypothetical protein
MYRIDADEPTLIKDLHITVGPNPVWLSRSDLEASVCLQALIRMRKVRVSHGERSRVSKPPAKKPPRSVIQSRPQKGPTHTRPIQPPAGLSRVEAQQMAQQAAEEAAKSAVAALMPAIHTILANQQAAPTLTPDLDHRIERVLSKVLSNAVLPSASGSAHATHSSVGPEEPMYIPTGIVKPNSEKLILQSQSSSDDGSLDNAAEALKALRRKK